VGFTGLVQGIFKRANKIQDIHLSPAKLLNILCLWITFLRHHKNTQVTKFTDDPIFVVDRVVHSYFRY